MQLNKEALLAKKPMFFNLWNDASDVFGSFADYGKEINEDGRFTVLFAEYEYEDYSGRAYVFGFDSVEDKFFEIHGGHCSCYGLEGQWSPEYCSIEELQELVARRQFDTGFTNWLKN